MSISAKLVNATDLATSRLWNSSCPAGASVSSPIVIASPVRPTVIATDRVSTGSPRRRGMRSIKPGRLLVEAERETERRIDEEVDPEHLARR